MGLCGRDCPGLPASQKKYWATCSRDNIIEKPATKNGRFSPFNPPTFSTSLFGMSNDAAADFSQRLPTTRRLAALRAHPKAGFRLPLGDDVRDKVVKQPLHTRAGGARRDQQSFAPRIITTIRNGFHFTIFRGCAGVTPRGEVN